MSYFRSYFSKNNTILGLRGGNGLLTNTAKNPNTEIYYGSGISKYIFKIDLTDLSEKIQNGDLVLNENTKHYLSLTNTIFGDEIFLGAKNGKGKSRATSFDLIVFEIDEEWDEGVGFDYEYSNGLDSDKTYSERPSNWEYRTTLDKWGEKGIYMISPRNTITTIHFDNGNENIYADITEYVNNLLTGNTQNYGLGIAFDPDYLLIENAMDQSVAFFTKYTQTFFEPFVESVFIDNIIDNRNNFILNFENNLYLYVKKDSNYYDLDVNPIVDILDKNKIPMDEFTNLSTQKIKKGIYKVNVSLNAELCDKKAFFYDVWKNLSINGNNLDDVTQKFIPKNYTEEFSIGDDNNNVDRYAIQFFGIKLNEKIKRGSTRKIIVTFKSINQQKSLLLDNVYYRIYIKEGKTNVNIFDWTPMDKTNENSFILNTNYMIPREYHIEIKTKIHDEEIYYNEDIKFEIVSEK